MADTSAKAGHNSWCALVRIPKGRTCDCDWFEKEGREKKSRPSPVGNFCERHGAHGTAGCLSCREEIRGG